MKMKVSQSLISPPDALPFSQVPDGSVFRLDTGKAVYLKVKLRHMRDAEGAAVYKMVELRTGDAFDPSKSDCLVLDGEAVILDW